MIRTKILATVGPGCGDPDTLRRMVQAGCDAFRINFSHGSPQERAARLAAIRQVEAELGTPLAVLADLCGPKIRVQAIAGGSVSLAAGQSLVIQRAPIEGTAQRISTTLGELIDEARVGEAILMDDGKIRLEVTAVRPPDEIVCRIVCGGLLSTGKGVNLPQTNLSLSALTEKDRTDAAWIAQRDFDYVALSFVRTAQDLRTLRQVLDAGGSSAPIVAKIEKPQAITNIHEIIATADAVMVARGDLGVEMNLPAVPVAQKTIARLCRLAGKPCIIATQMLESMTASLTPTRAEVSDVANAVLDGADAVMLSGETATGKYPVETVAMMNDVVTEIQAYHDQHAECARVEYAPARTVAALAAAVREIIAEDDIAAVAVFTMTGTTARMFAKNRLTRPILGISPHLSTVRRMCLYYGVAAVQGEQGTHTRDVLDQAAKFAVQRGIASSGQKIVVVSGRPLNQPGCANTLVVHTVE